MCRVQEYHDAATFGAVYQAAKAKGIEVEY
jgi:hypothetical protein